MFMPLVPFGMIDLSDICLLYVLSLRLSFLIISPPGQAYNISIKVIMYIIYE